MRIPKLIISILNKITERKGCELEFWKSLEGDDLIDLFFDLSGELMMSDIDESDIPEGYVWLAYIFYWETNCQFSGWYAIENKKDEMEKILECYKKVGLSAEAEALEKAVEAWVSSNQNHDKTGEAYKSVPNEYTDEDDRFVYLAEYFSKNSRALLYVPE